MSVPAPTGPLIAIVGPTAVGKTALAMALASELPVEVVSADSRQVYRFMDIGTAKPTAEERSRVRHRLVDVVDPDEPFSLAQYQRMAYAAIEEIVCAGKLPLLVGGTGLYVRAVLDGLVIPAVQPDRALRQRLQDEARTDGAESLHRRLHDLDPVAADRIDARNVRRVVRALEVCLQLGEPISGLQRAVAPPYDILRLGLRLERSELYQRIDGRIDRMLEQGLVQEVQSLVTRGYGYDLPSMSGLGYRQIGMYLRGEVDLVASVALIRRHTRRLVRQQSNWFRAGDPGICWLTASEGAAGTALARVRQFLDTAGKLQVNQPGAFEGE